MRRARAPALAARAAGTRRAPRLGRDFELGRRLLRRLHLRRLLRLHVSRRTKRSAERGAAEGGRGSTRASSLFSRSTTTSGPPDTALNFGSRPVMLDRPSLPNSLRTCKLRGELGAACVCVIGELLTSRSAFPSDFAYLHGLHTSTIHAESAHQIKKLYSFSGRAPPAFLSSLVHRAPSPQRASRSWLPAW